MNRIILPLIALILFSSSIAVAGSLTGDTGDEQLLTRHRGACLITVSRDNAGVLSELAPICKKDVPRIFEQLGVDATVKPFAPVVIHVVNHPREMHRLAPPGTSLPIWSGAVAFPTHNLVMLPLQHMDGGTAMDLGTTLLHEVSHIAFHRVSGDTRTPRWFSEGVAILQSEGSSFHRKQSIWWASLIDDISPLSEIERYPEGARAAEQAYAQAADFTAFLIEREGWNGIRYLLSNLHSGDGFDAAFHKSYGTKVARLETQWREQLFGGMGWLMNVTGDGVWLGFAALLCIVGFFVTRRRKHRRLAEMAEEENRLEQTISTIDQLITLAPAAVTASGTPPVPAPAVPMSPAMDRIRKQRTRIEIEGEFHTLH